MKIDYINNVVLCRMGVIMVKFIIVDDEKKYLDKVKKIVSEVSFITDDEVNIDVYSELNDDLLKEIDTTDSKKVYILDIDLNNGTSGIKLAEKIRVNDWDSEIIFITNHDKMFETVHRSVLSVFCFIEKFHDFDDKLREALTKIINKNFDNKMFKYESRSTSLNLYYRSILYIYRDTQDRRLRIVTDSNEFIIGISLQEMLDRLDDRFKMTHRACIVNQKRVDCYSWTKNYFQLDNGKQVYLLSKKYRKCIEGKECDE